MGMLIDNKMTTINDKCKKLEEELNKDVEILK